MITPAYVRLMAQYNAEMNRRLYAAAARLTDAERKADRGAFWQSIHGTLTHILWGDTQWMSRFDAWPKPDVGQKQSAGMVDDFAVLLTRRTKADADITTWANRVDDAWLAEDLVWFSGSAAEGDAAAEGTAGGALLQPPDASPRPGACAAHRVRSGHRRHRSVPGGARGGVNRGPCLLGNRVGTADGSAFRVIASSTPAVGRPALDETSLQRHGRP